MEKTEGNLQEEIAACSKLAKKDDSWEGEGHGHTHWKGKHRAQKKEKQQKPAKFIRADTQETEEALKLGIHCRSQVSGILPFIESPPSS